MPLIALCRTRGNEQQMDGQSKQIECIQSGASIQVQIGNLPYSNLLILIHSPRYLICEYILIKIVNFSIFQDDISSSSANRLFKTLIRCIDFHYGPQLQLISMPSSKLIRNIQRRCEQRMLNILMEIDESNQQATTDDGNFLVILNLRIIRKFKKKIYFSFLIFSQ